LFNEPRVAITFKATHHMSSFGRGVRRPWTGPWSTTDDSTSKFALMGHVQRKEGTLAAYNSSNVADRGWKALDSAPRGGRARRVNRCTGRAGGDWRNRGKCRSRAPHQPAPAIPGVFSPHRPSVCALNPLGPQNCASHAPGKFLPLITRPTSRKRAGPAQSHGEPRAQFRLPSCCCHGPPKGYSHLLSGPAFVANWCLSHSAWPRP